jgi:GTPase
VNLNIVLSSQLTSQLKWRLFEGQGEAFYEIGIEDNGTARGLPAEELEKSIQTVRRMAKNLGCEVFEICKRKAKEGEIAELLVREVRDDKYMDVRIAVCGNVDAGKSTFIGVLTKGHLDNGRGLARVNVFNHKHEIETGRTSSISQQILGFNAKGECVNYLAANTVHRDMTWGDIVEQSYKVISFIDLAGHEKYLKTTVSGMTGHMPDYCFLMVGANMGVTRMTKEHLALALALKIPLIVVVTKVDICPEGVLQQTLSDITRILKMRGVNKMPLMIKTDDDFISAVKSIAADRIVPIFLVSNVTGKDLDLVRKFLNLVPPRIEWALLRDNKHPEVLIDQTYFVTGVGTVVGGTVMSGSIQANDSMLLGPDSLGAFIPVQIKSVHSKRVPVKQVVAGMSAGFALKKIKRSTIRKGMVLVPVNSNPQPTIYFEADVIILYHSTTIHKNYQPVIQCLTIRQSAKIMAILGEKDVLRTGDRAKILFKFMYRPEFLKEGMRVIFREGRCKAVGLLLRVAIPEAEALAMTEKAEKDAAASKASSSTEQR